MLLLEKTVLSSRRSQVRLGSPCWWAASRETTDLTLWSLGRHPELSGFLSALLVRLYVPSAAHHCLGLPERWRREEELDGFECTPCTLCFWRWRREEELNGFDRIGLDQIGKVWNGLDQIWRVRLRVRDEVKSQDSLYPCWISPWLKDEVPWIEAALWEIQVLGLLL